MTLLITPNEHRARIGLPRSTSTSIDGDLVESERGDRGASSAKGADVGINLTWLSPGVVGGTEEHAVQLLRGLASMPEMELDVNLYANKEFEQAYPDICQHWKIQTMPWPGWLNKLVPRPVAKVARVLFENSWLAAVTRRDSVVHHLGGSVPLVRRAAAIVTIHDLQPMDLPQNFSAPKRLWLRWLLPHSARSASRTLCPSNFTAKRVEDCLGADASTIEVVPYSCHDPAELPQNPVDATGANRQRQSEPRSGGGERSTDQLPDWMRSNLDLSANSGLDIEVDPFLLYPAIPYAHKRHIDIVETITLLAPEYPNLSVVFTGREGPETAALKDRAERLGVADRIHFLGRVPASQLDWLYRHALAVIFPSSYEGFGNPVLEAMARECPVIVSSAGSLPEVVGDAGLVVEVGNIAEYANAVTSLLETPRMARLLAAKARARFEEVDPGITAARTAAVYRDVLSSQVQA